MLNVSVYLNSFSSISNILIAVIWVHLCHSKPATRYKSLTIYFILHFIPNTCTSVSGTHISLAMSYKECLNCLMKRMFVSVNFSRNKKETFEGKNLLGLFFISTVLHWKVKYVYLFRKLGNINGNVNFGQTFRG